MASHLINLEFNKTYATRDNAIKAAEKAYGKHEAHLRYIVIPVEILFKDSDRKDIRYGVAFLGQEALQNMVHFHFNVIG